MRTIVLFFLLAVVALEASPSDQVQKFLTSFNTAVNSKDEGTIEKLFQSGFTYHGCNGEFRKERMIKYLSQHPSGKSIVFNLIPNSVFGPMSGPRGRLIQFSVTNTNLGVATDETKFYYDEIANQLFYGFDTTCSKINFLVKRGDGRGKVNASEAEVVSKDFLRKLEKAVSTKRIDVVRELFLRDFVYDNCRSRINKLNMAKFFAEEPYTSPMLYKSSEDFGSAIRFIVTFREENIEFYLNKAHNQLESGAIIECSRKNPTHVKTYPTPDSLSDILNAVVEKRNIFSMQELFTNDFQWVTCQAVYSKEELIRGIASIPLATKVSFSVKDQKQVGTSMKYHTTVTGLNPIPMNIEIILNYLKYPSSITSVIVNSPC